MVVLSRRCRCEHFDHIESLADSTSPMDVQVTGEHVEQTVDPPPASKSLIRGGLARGLFDHDILQHGNSLSVNRTHCVNAVIGHFRHRVK